MSAINKENPPDGNHNHNNDHSHIINNQGNNMADQHNVKGHDHVPLKPMVKVLAVFAAIGGFLFGYDTGVVSGAMIQLRDKFNLNTLWQELVVSVTIGAAAVASFAGMFLNNKFGRRPVIILASVIFAVGSLVLAFAPVKEVLLLGRLIVGLGVGKL